MAIYHFSAQIISRSKGRCSVAAAAYRAGEKLKDERTGLSFDYNKKTGIEHTEILASPNAPSWATDREKLWNEVEKVEKRKDAQLAREINVALPNELSKEQKIELIRGFVKETFVDNGMIADIAIHDTNKGNPHAHVMLTTREIDTEGFGKKNRDWNSKEQLEEWREKWAEYANKALEKANVKERIDHRTLKEQGIERVPQIHVGVHANAMEKKGMETDRVRINDEIKEFNKTKVVELEQYRKEKIRLEKENSRYKYLNNGEKEMVLKAESILGEHQSYDNSNRYIDKLYELRKEEVDKYNNLNDKGKELGTKVSNIKFSLENISKFEKSLEELPKGFFGYKDKDAAETIKNNIQRYKEILDKEGYKDSSDIRNYETEINDISGNKEIISNEISDIESKIKIIKTGIEELNKSEAREFIDNFKDEFKPSEYLQYNEIKAIKESNEYFNKQLNSREIKNIYYKDLESLEEINLNLKGVKNVEDKINTAKRAFETIEKYEDVAHKYENKLIGKEKYQREHQHEYNLYENARKTLYDMKITSKEEFNKQENLLNSLNKEQLIKSKTKIETEMNKIKPAFEAIENAERKDGLQKKKEIDKEMDRSNENDGNVKDFRKDFRSRGFDRSR